MTKKAMELIDAESGKMKCKVCGAEHIANVQLGGKFKRGAWQCQNGCKEE